MKLNAVQIQGVLESLDSVYANQIRILNEADQVICTQLAGAWKSQAQKAYVEVFIGAKENTLKQINELILAFRNALEKTQNGLYQVDVNLKSMNISQLSN